jgi:quinol monooxygenase YgiN
MIIVTGSVIATPNSFEHILDLSLEHVERSRREPGCVSHDVSIDCQNPMRLFFFERWESDAALKAHFQVPESREFIKALKESGAELAGPDIYAVHA